MVQYARSGPRVINYEDEWLPPVCQHGLLVWLGTGHSGQSYHGSPAGSGSSGPTDWPRSSWTDRSSGCHPLPSLWSSGSCEDLDRFSDGSSNQTACMAGEHQGHEWQILWSQCCSLVCSWNSEWLRVPVRTECVMFCAVWTHSLECIVSTGV